MSIHEREDPRAEKQDAALVSAWRDGSAEQPSARTDAAILAAAHKAAGNLQESPPATTVRVPVRRRWNQWAPMAAAAAVAGLALVLVQTLPRDPQLAPTPAAQESAREAAPAGVSMPASTPPDALEPQTVAAPRAVDSVSPVAQERTATPAMTGASPAVPAPPAGMPTDGVAGAAVAVTQAPSAGSDESRSSLNAARSKAAESAVADQAASTDEWVVRIQSAHSAGDIAAATDALREFRAAVPNADRLLPEPLREWAETVP